MTDRREGVSVYYRRSTHDRAAEEDVSTVDRLWELMTARLDDPQVRADAERLPEVLAERSGGRSWADSVAGDMERHYSPGRTWEATTRALVPLIDPGRVLDVASGDGAIAELLGPHARSMDCIDISRKVVEAGQQRVAALDGVRFHLGDMHALPFDDEGFDTVLLLHALSYSEQPERAVAEACRVLAPGGSVVCATLHRHRHVRQVESFGHVNTGFETDQLSNWFAGHGVDVRQCAITSVESKSPNFEIITLLAEKP